ncbi:MAG: HU family DNA-binding protein [Desulfovibrio sp.]|uniref:HU family DNA-binding protein n=1 Tax=Desulfovibrio sp. TaxID=885 RepID=UPI001A7AAB53|nr:HU family DNA-binding protein [Desulfovibrio sp.]MBD5417362.1 HU family DNA-binding protein [Desulfovibrio sp.]
MKNYTLLEIIQEKTGLSFQESSELWDALCAQMSNILADAHAVNIPHVGRFYIKPSNVEGEENFKYLGFTPRRKLLKRLNGLPLD